MNAKRLFADGIEAVGAEAPSAGEAGAVVERRVHLEVAVVVLDLAEQVVAPRAHAARPQRRQALRVAAVGGGGRRVQRHAGHLQRRAALLQADVGAGHGVRGRAVRGRRHDGAGVAAGREERRLGAADGEHLVVAVERIAGLEIPSGRLIDRREHAERRVAQRSGDLAADDRVDDAARVHRGDHVAVAAADAGQGEGSGALHEERPLLREEDRVALVHLDLERVALDLAEVGVHRGVDGDRRRHARTSPRARPTRRRRTPPTPTAWRALPSRSRRRWGSPRGSAGRAADRTPAARGAGTPTRSA